MTESLEPIVIKSVRATITIQPHTKPGAYFSADADNQVRLWGSRWPIPDSIPARLSEAKEGLTNAADRILAYTAMAEFVGESALVDEMFAKLSPQVKMKLLREAGIL